MPPFSNVFYEIAAVLSVATGAGALALWLRQPLPIAFIAVGFALGPAGMGWIGDSEQVEFFAELGVTLLLFVVGLKLDPHEIRAVGPVAIAVGIGQIVLTGSLSFWIGLGFGFSAVKAFYVAIALTFSSTIITVKLLSDKREIDALHGRIALGVLIVQDIAVVLVMIGLTALSGEDGSASFGLALLVVALKGLGFLGVLAAIARYLLPSLLHSVARSPELLALCGISAAIALAAEADALGFSKEVGAFLAGVAIASTPYRVPMSSRLVNLRDFLLLFFFLNLGLHIHLESLGAELLPALVFSGFVLLGKPLMVLVLMGLMKYRKYTSALTGLSLSQISEFSLILAALGVSLGHIDNETLGLLTLVALITMTLSTYLILYSHELYPRISHWLDLFERQIAHHEQHDRNSSDAAVADVDAIVFGLGRYGGSVVENLRSEGFTVLGVDFDPEVVTFWRSQGLWTLYGDADDPELAALMPLKEAKWVVSTVPNCNVGLALLHTLQHQRYRGQVVLTSHTRRDEEILLGAGADRVLLPFRDAAKEAARRIVADRSLEVRDSPVN
ncbi:cation:proton antiporter [Synechococcus sp. PCC 7336]|uniref:cation:proton antiporter n=1 Tax=Synechococcus sp. PCC 7336 TaxID=195250 RepID=UPI000344C742|nr:cation:proton antiporter family protein [Synechococcus sp. PCC 7336]